MAKASERDMEAALELMQILHAVDGGYYPGKDDDEAATLFFDEEDLKHLRLFYDRVKGCMDRAPGFVGRVIGGFHTLMHNDLVDPDQDCLALHPRLQKALDDVERLRGLLLWALFHHQGGRSAVGQPIRVALGIGEFDELSAEQVAAAWKAGEGGRKDEIPNT